MKRTIVNSGDRYGRLTIISEAPTIFHKHGSTRRFNCLCDCGNIKEISLCSLKGTTKSCGCQNKEWVKQGNSNRKHGDSSKLSEHNYIYATWRAIRQRCYDPNAMNYHNYGGRGISCFWKNDYTCTDTFP